MCAMKGKPQHVLITKWYIINLNIRSEDVDNKNESWFYQNSYIPNNSKTVKFILYLTGISPNNILKYLNVKQIIEHFGLIKYAVRCIDLMGKKNRKEVSSAFIKM